MSGFLFQHCEGYKMKDGDIYVNEHGGRQSYVSTRLDLIPPENQILLGQCLGWGAKEYGENNWHQIPENENLNHALVHITLWLNGDRSEPHLVNAIARLHFALWHAIQSKEQPTGYIHPRMKQEAEDDKSENLIDEVLRAAKDKEGFDATPTFTDFENNIQKRPTQENDYYQG